MRLQRGQHIDGRITFRSYKPLMRSEFLGKRGASVYPQ